MSNKENNFNMSNTEGFTQGQLDEMNILFGERSEGVVDLNELQWIEEKILGEF